MNRKQFLDMLRKQHAYSGKADLTEVKAFLNDPENGIVLVDSKGKAVDVDAIWAKTVKVSISADAGEEVDVQQDKSDDSSEVSAAAGVGGEGIEPPGQNSLAGRKTIAANATQHGPAIRTNGSKHRRYNELAKQGKTRFSCAEAAEEFGNFCVKLVHASNGKAQSLGTNSAGGYTVPTDVLSELISNRADVGIARAVCRHFNIARDKANVPMRTGGYTVYAPGENTAITASDAAFGQCAFDAVQMGVLVAASVELLHDSVLDFGEFIADEINYAFAMKEDEILFAPVGTSSTFSAVSVPRAIYNQVVTTAGGTWTTDAHKLYHPGVTNADGNAWSEITLANLKAVPGKLPDYAHKNACWVVSQAFWGLVMEPLAYTVGGTSTTELINGIPQKYFMGYPVFRTSQMPTAEANSQICALFGDFTRSAAIADVKDGMSLDVDKSIYFPNASIAFRGLQRSAFTVFDVGTANSSAGSRVSGPMCALATLNA